MHLRNLVLFSTICALCSAIVLPRQDNELSNATVGETGGSGDIVLQTTGQDNGLLVKIVEELFGQVIETEFKETINAIRNLFKIPKEEREFNKQFPSRIVDNFWNRGYNVAAFCSEYMTTCSNCQWRTYEVGGEQGDSYRCGILGLSPNGQFVHNGPGGFVNWGYAWRTGAAMCDRVTEGAKKTVTCRPLLATTSTDAELDANVEIVNGTVISGAAEGGDDNDGEDDAN